MYPKIRTTYSIKDGEGLSIEFVLADVNGTDVPMAIKDCGLEGDGREVTLDGLELLYCQMRPDSSLCVKVERGLKRKRASRKIEVLMEYQTGQI